MNAFPKSYRFADVLSIINGRNQKKVEAADGQYPIYGSGGIMGWANDYICPENTVVIGRKGSINNPIYVDRKFWNVDTAFGLVPNRNLLLPRYLFYFCVCFDFEKLNTTVTIPSLTKTNLLQIKMFLPSLGEQEKIICRLDKLCHLIELKREQLKQLDVLAKSRFIEMFGDPTVATDTLTRPMPDICEIIDGDRGKNYPTLEEFSESGFCLFLNAKNVTDKGFQFENCMFITEQKDSILRKGKLQRGDVVLTTRGTLGNLAFYDKSVPYEHIRINSGMVILRMNHSLISEIFFMEQFRMQLTSIKQKIASGSAQPQLPINTMNQIRMIVPPLALQNEFAAFIEELDKSKFTIRRSLEKLEMLYQALLQEYFG